MGVYMHELVALHLPKEIGEPEYVQNLTGGTKQCNKELRALILSLMEPLESDRPKNMGEIMKHDFFKGYNFEGFEMVRTDYDQSTRFKPSHFTKSNIPSLVAAHPPLQAR